MHQCGKIARTKAPIIKLMECFAVANALSSSTSSSSSRRLISRKAVALMRGTSVSTEKRLEKLDPDYPRRVPVTLGDNPLVRWWRDEIFEYSENKRC